MRFFLGFFSIFLSLFNHIIHIFTAKKGFLRVILYHQIDDPSSFKEHMDFLNAHYTIIDMMAFEKMISGRLPIRGKNILITFDDGFKSNRVAAEEVLEPLGIKACFFVLPDLIGKKASASKQLIAKTIFNAQVEVSDIDDRYALMDKDDLMYLLEKGHTIGSHTCSHKRLSALHDVADLKHEIVDSGDCLEAMLSVKIKHFAYPFGDIDSISSEALTVAKTRYDFVFSGVRGNNTVDISPLALRRDSVPLENDCRYLRFIVEGGLSIYYRIRRDTLDKMVASKC